MVIVSVKETVNNSSFKLCPVESDILFLCLAAICSGVGPPSQLNSMLSLAQVLIVNVKTFQSHNNDKVEGNDTWHRFCPE